MGAPLNSTLFKCRSCAIDRSAVARLVATIFNNCDGWNVYTQTVAIKNRSNIAIVISNAKSDANGTDNIWVCSRTREAEYVTIAPGETGTFTFNVLAKGYSSPDDVKSALKKLNPSIVFAENKSAADQTFVKFDMINAEKFAIDIKF